MTGKRATRLFITGTNTAVGKTHVAATLARTWHGDGHRVGVYKPVLSGGRPSHQPPGPDCRDDDVLLWHAAGRPGTLAQVSPQRYSAPLAPPLAAHQEGRSVDELLLRQGIAPWEASSDWILIEGAGGLFSPISTNDLNADLALDLQAPILLVAANMLGTIHATLATLLAARSYRVGVPITAVVLSDSTPNSDGSQDWNEAELSRRCAPTPVWRLPYGATTSPQLARHLEKALKVPPA